MAIADLTDWIEENTDRHIVWYVKRLSGNDTLANGSHQAGPYIPKEFLFEVFPSLHRADAENPDTWFEVRIDSHGDARNVRATWYNNKFRGGTRNEARLTNFGGAESALLDPESTGSLAVFAFHKDESGQARVCRVWVCDHETEADVIEDRIGPVEPGKFLIWTVDDRHSREFQPSQRTSCWLEPEEIPAEWLTRFPTGAEIISRAIALRSDHRLAVDQRLLRRRDCEFQVFRSLEQAVELPAIQAGFNNIDDFIARAQTILQRRKSRSGRSLELHARAIFNEEQLRDGVDFDHQPESEPGKRPDFLFPSEVSYKDTRFPANRLRMLAAKTTCKDRWRQILNEADRIPVKHILTLQEGISENQFREMSEASVQLVVPTPLMTTYPQTVRPYLQSLESFIADVRLLNLNEPRPPI
ncbi:MAG: type II restriction endonuclease [Planctomycetaceae bacterium]